MLFKDEKDIKVFFGGCFVGVVLNYIDECISFFGFVKEFGCKIFFDYWLFMFGEIVLWSFVVVFFFGIFLMFFFQVFMVEMYYMGVYVLMCGIEMLVVFELLLYILFDFCGGLFVCQIYYWVVFVFIVGIGVYMFCVFFMGVFCKLCEFNWVIGFVFFIFVMVEGFMGYLFFDDLFLGNGFCIIDGMIKGFLLIGMWILFFLFGGEFFGIDIVGCLYMLYILLLLMFVIVLIVVYFMFMIVNKYMQFVGFGCMNDNVVGYLMMFVYMLKMGGYLFIVFGVIVLIVMFFQINLIWNYGFYDFFFVFVGIQFDWYIGFVDGVLCLVLLNWDIVFFDYIWLFGIIVLVLVFGLFIVIVVIYLFFEVWVMGDKCEYYIVQCLCNVVICIVIGVVGVVFYVVLWVVVLFDFIVMYFMFMMEGVIYMLQVLFFLGLIFVYFVIKCICIVLQKKDCEIVLYGFEFGCIVCFFGGEFIEVYQLVDKYDCWKFIDVDIYELFVVCLNFKGCILWMENFCFVIFCWFFEDCLVLFMQVEVEVVDVYQYYVMVYNDEIEVVEIQGVYECVGFFDVFFIVDEIYVDEMLNIFSMVIFIELVKKFCCKKLEEDGV